MKAGADVLQLTRLSKILNTYTSNKDEVDSSMPDEKVSILCLKADLDITFELAKFL